MNEFYTAYPLVDQLYGVEITEEFFEEVGLIAWRLIGNKKVKLYRYSSNIVEECSGCRETCKPRLSEYKIELPCNADIIEAVTYGFEDWNYTTNLTLNGSIKSYFTENYIETRKEFNNPLYASGKFVKYERVGNTLHFDRDYGVINVLYKGVLLDPEGLPYINDKEAHAISTYCAMTKLRRDGLKTRNNALVEQAQFLQQEWIKLSREAKVPEYISQNEMNEILDASTNWDRKVFNKSYKIVK